MIKARKMKRLHFTRTGMVLNGQTNLGDRKVIKNTCKTRVWLVITVAVVLCCLSMSAADFDDVDSWATFDPGEHGVGNDPDGYHAAVFDNRYIYFAPSNNGSDYHGEVLRYDTTMGFTDVSSWETFDPGEHGVGTDPDGYAGAAFDNRYIYFAPQINGSDYHGEVLRYDTTVGFTDVSSWETFDPGEHGVGTDPDGYLGAAFDNRYIYFVPIHNGSGYHGEVLRYDTTVGFTDVSSWATFNPEAQGVGTDPRGFANAIFDNRCIYFVPYRRPSFHGEVMRYETMDPNLIAHWKFDEGTGLTAYDSASENHGTLINGPQWTTGQIGGALEFDGVDDYVETVILDIDVISISAWVNVADGDNQGHYHIVGNWEYAGYGLAYNYQNNNKFIFTVHVGGAYRRIFSDEIPERNKWYHVAGTYDGEAGFLYINGSKQTQAINNSGLFGDSGQPVIIGGNPYPGGAYLHFAGTIDDVRIYNEALSPENVFSLYEESFPPCRAYHVDAVSGDDNNNGCQASTAFATIQKGIEVAEDGDTILVHPGLYQQEVDFVGKAITIQGFPDADGVPVLEFPIAASFVSGEGPESVLKNFIIQNSYIAVFIVDSSPTLSNLNIMNNDYGIETYADSYPDIANCIFWNNASSDLYGCEAHHSWVPGGVDPVPMFVDPNNGDYHLLSEKGRYWPAHDVWVLDEQTSPCIDAGDPAVDPSAEPMPNGGRINMGVYGGTDYASMSEWPLREDSNRDGVVSMIDLANLAGKWLHQLDWVE
jgi:hypothetical protein